MSQIANQSQSNLFAIQESEWTAINQRVGAVLATSKIENYISQYLPGYPDLLASCRLWVSTTFDGLITQSTNMVPYADNAISEFTILQAMIAGLNPDAPTVPDDAKKQTKESLNNLSASTTPLSQTVDQLNSQVYSFLEANKLVDLEMEKSKDKFGLFFTPLGKIISEVENATGLVTGVWNAINGDLKLLTSTDIEITMPFITGLQIDASIVCWKSLKEEAIPFPVMANNQKRYWSTT
jgi:hypothetical protein